MSTTVSPPNSSNAPATAVITPGHSSLKQRMSVDKKIVDELLLVCGVLGSTDETTGEFVPVEDCLNWLQDLQRALRRDDDLYRPISLLLGQWKVVQQKLLPLVVSCRYDTAMVLTICKILVILTKPLAENTVRAGKMVIDTQKTHGRVVKEQIKLRENALQQAETLMDYKRAFCHSKEKDGQGPLSVFVSLLAEPLSKQGSSRTDSDHLTIELVLHLFRNLLAAEPLLFSSSDALQRSHQLRADFLCLLEKELVLDILLVLGANLDQRENAQYNLLLMELLNHMLRQQDPTAVTTSASQKNNKPTKPQAGLLKSQLRREKLTTSIPLGARHSNFGGTLQLKKGDRRQYVSTAALLPGNAAAAPARSKKKKAEPFCPSATHQHSIHARRSTPAGPAAHRAHLVLHRFGPRFVSECFGPVLKSLKNEFRRDSVRLEGGDRVVLFRLVWFWMQWWRTGGRKEVPDLGQLIFGMDLFSFQLVLNSVDHFQQRKDFTSLAQTVALLSEMMHILFDHMYQSKEPTEQLMALGLLDRLYYGEDPLDRLPKLLSQWSPGMGTREYLCDVAEICHMTMKLLDAQAEACKEYASGSVPKKKKKDKDPQDTVAKLKESAANFDVLSYWTRKVVSNHTVYMYTQLLSQYAFNAPQVNHRVITFFMRLAKVKVVVPDEPDPDMPQNPLASKKVTLEPMLFNVSLVMVLNTVLNDKSIARDPDYVTVLSFASNLVYKFSQAAQSNPLLFVEAMLTHPVPHRYCELVTNLYVNEELRMLADRELLLEGQERLEEQVAAAERHDEEDDGDSEDEVEFEDFGLHAIEKNGNKTPSDEDHDSDDESASSEKLASEKEGQLGPGAPCSQAKKRVIDDFSDEEAELAFNEESQSKRPRAIADDSDED